MQGYIKDHRKELDSDIWMMPPHYHRIWQYLKYMVNHQDKRIPMDESFMTIKAGQHLTSIRKIARGVGWYERGQFKELNPKTVSKVLEWLVDQGMIKVSNGQGNTKYTLVTLINWESYQTKDNESNSEGTAREQSVDTNKNVKNDKNDYVVVDDTREQKSNHAVDAIAERYADLRTMQEGKEIYPSISDYYAIAQVVARGIPLPQTIKWLDQCFEEYQERDPNGAIKSFKYCMKYIESRHEQHLAKDQAKEVKPNARHGNNPQRDMGKGRTGQEQFVPEFVGRYKRA
ncbi:hypothetical protein [Geomicrobium sp. JCM 19039]|uniref:hypothetical protein n=1 Tax=Geomicrobium sp. JCM 19039 TaxID=1460636 RepID=UPI00045F1C35|nr:hypothetical protein [Geomicrobium sp. JCM 19039]GAK12216.1 YkxB protein [Geomicrobium sp. JCM 19039]